jgi:signal transduction histidine kinase
MRERLEQIGGTVDVRAGPDDGRVAASMPLSITPAS